MIRIRHTIALALALALLLPASAMAGAVREYQLQYEPTGDPAGALMIVSALVNPQTPLPVTITVPVPKGATLLWAGEVLGGAPADDPVRTTTVEQVGDMDVYTLTVEQSYTAQLEIQLPAPSASGNTMKSSVVWTNPGEDVLVTSSVILEAGASEVKTTPELSGTVQTNDAGAMLHPLAGVQLASGDSYEIAVEWTRAGSATATGGSSPVLPILLGLLVVAIVALVVVIARERTRARRAGSTDAGNPPTEETATGEPASDEPASEDPASDDFFTWS